LIEDPWFWALALPAVALTGISKGGTGGGAAVATPLMAIVIPPATAAAIMLPVLCLMDIAGIRGYLGKWDRRVMRILVPSGLAGCLVGALTFRYMSEHWIRILVGATALGFLAWTLYPRKRFMRKPGTAAGWLWGTLSGFTSFITHAGSPRHLGLYQKFGFWPRFLTAVMKKPVVAGTRLLLPATFAQLTENNQQLFLAESSSLTDKILSGLTVENEISAVQARSLGDTVILRDGKRLSGFAVCHCGPGTEAGFDTCLIKFGAVRPGAEAAEAFRGLLNDCETFAAARGMKVLTASVNTARHEAYCLLLELGFSTYILGVTMHRPNDEFYSRPGAFLMDDWR